MQLIAKLRKVRGKLIPKFVRLTILYLKSDKKWTAYALLMFLVALMLADTTIGVYLIWQTGEFTTALAERDADRFWKSTYLTIFLIAIGFPTFGLYYYVRDRFALHWRSWLVSIYWIGPAVLCLSKSTVELMSFAVQDLCLSAMSESNCN